MPAVRANGGGGVASAPRRASSRGEEDGETEGRFSRTFPLFLGIAAVFYQSIPVTKKGLGYGGKEEKRARKNCAGDDVLGVEWVVGGKGFLSGVSPHRSSSSIAIVR